MSFQPLVVDGWYHLLGEKLGMTKHLQIPCASSRGQGNLGELFLSDTSSDSRCTN